MAIGTAAVVCDDDTVLLLLPAPEVAVVAAVVALEPVPGRVDAPSDAASFFWRARSSFTRAATTGTAGVDLLVEMTRGRMGLDGAPGSTAVVLPFAASGSGSGTRRTRRAPPPPIIRSFLAPSPSAAEGPSRTGRMGPLRAAPPTGCPASSVRRTRWGPDWGRSAALGRSSVMENGRWGPEGAGCEGM